MKLGKSQQYIPEITANIVNTPKTIVNGKSVFPTKS